MTSNMEKGESAKGKIKINLIVLEIVIAVGILAIPLFWVQRIARAASTGKAMLAHFDSTTTDRNIPVYRIWNGSSWDTTDSEANTVGGDPYWCVLRSCPKRNEKIMGTLDDAVGGDINVQVWNGSAWGNLKELTTAAGTTAKRAFDIAYEQSSGDALVVFSDDTDTPKYSVWTGSTWTAGGSCLPTGEGVIEWVRLEPKPNSNEIMIVTQGSLYDVYAQVWDGDTAGYSVHMTSLTQVRADQCFDVAYEQSSGRAMVVYTAGSGVAGVHDVPQYSIWDGSQNAWVAGGGAALINAGELRWAKLAAKPGSDELVLGTSDDLSDTQVQLWYSGATATWSDALTEVETALPGLGRRYFDVAYESTSGRPMIVWSANDETAEYCIWDGSSWSGDSTAMSATATYSVAWVALASNPDSNEIMLMTSNFGGSGAFDDEYNVKKWDGSNWDTDPTNVETAGYTNYESFAIDYDRHSPQVSIIIQKWRELYH